MLQPQTHVRLGQQHLLTRVVAAAGKVPLHPRSCCLQALWRQHERLHLRKHRSNPEGNKSGGNREAACIHKELTRHHARPAVASQHTCAH